MAYIMTFFASLNKTYLKVNNDYMPPRARRRFLVMQAGFFVVMFIGILLFSLEIHAMHTL